MVRWIKLQSNLETFRNGQLRAVAAGSRLKFFSTAHLITALTTPSVRELVSGSLLMAT